MPNEFAQAVERWAEVCESAARLARDGFKAPEQVIEAVKPVLDAAWNVQIEYVVALRKNRDD
jgi:HEAT repeat protein